MKGDKIIENKTKLLELFYIVANNRDWTKSRKQYFSKEFDGFYFNIDVNKMTLYLRIDAESKYDHDAGYSKIKKFKYLWIFISDLKLWKAYRKIKKTIKLNKKDKADLEKNNTFDNAIEKITSLTKVEQRSEKLKTIENGKKEI